MSETPKASGSLADRITGPPASKLDAASTSFTPSNPSSSWADEVASPVGVGNESKQLGATLEDAQLDGAAPPLAGSGLHDAQYEVEVKLSDIQGDKDSPLFSVSSFEELGM
jgi:ATP-dependent RNA helicase DDX19/DBP5